MLNRILIDPQAFAQSQDSLCGTVALSDLDSRVLSGDIVSSTATVQYTLMGGLDKWQRPVLHLTLNCHLSLQCQRCMQAMDFPINETVHIVLFDSEDKLDEALLQDEELDGMLCGTELDVYSLIEDELLMTLPLSPKHSHCDEVNLTLKTTQNNPFGVLAGLKKTD